MEAVILIGLQASGKSSFCRDHFFNSHIRINLDMLKTRHREKLIFQACLEAKQSVVIDNTNPTVGDRQRYIIPAKEKNFSIVGYYLESVLQLCLERNQQRSDKQIVPKFGVIATQKKLVLPSYEEGFDELYYVSQGENHTFIIQNWQI